MSRFDAALGRLNDRLFAHYGDEAVLRGAETTTVVLSRNVELIGEHGVVDQVVTTAALRTILAPKKGDSLIVAGTSWRLDAPLRGDGDIVEWVIVEERP